MLKGDRSDIQLSGIRRLLGLRNWTVLPSRGLHTQRTALTLHAWQLEAVYARLQGRHVVAVQPCGSGKTALFVAPILVMDELAKTSGTNAGTGRVAVVVCPRDAIEEQVVRVFLINPRNEA